MRSSYVWLLTRRGMNKLYETCWIAANGRMIQECRNLPNFGKEVSVLERHCQILFENFIERMSTRSGHYAKRASVNGFTCLNDQLLTCSKFWILLTLTNAPVPALKAALWRTWVDDHLLEGVSLEYTKAQFRAKMSVLSLLWVALSGTLSATDHTGICRCDPISRDKVKLYTTKSFGAY